MKKNHHISDQAELERLICRYFDGETTIQEEQELRRCLADCPWNSEIIDDTRFTVGYFIAHERQNRRLVEGKSLHLAGIAASIALLIGAGCFALWQQSGDKNQCIAYVNGRTVNDDTAVMLMIENDLSEIADASMGIASQLSSLGESIELDNE